MTPRIQDAKKWNCITCFRLKTLKTKPYSEAHILGQTRECPAPLLRGSKKKPRPVGDKPVGYLQASLWTADAIPVVASLPPKIFFGGESGDDRKCVCCSQASLYAIYKHAWPKQSVPVVRNKPNLRNKERLALYSSCLIKWHSALAKPIWSLGQSGWVMPTLHQTP